MSQWDWPAEAFKDEPEKLEQHYAERAASGFSTFDWWNFDNYIAGVIGAAVRKFSGGHGYPGEFKNMEEFAEFCKTIYEPLEFYCSEEYGNLRWEEQEPAYNAAIEAMQKFSERLGAWWD
ncbi:hypothetical protein SEA_MOAB_94 [Streptomyces phage Moab]|nr:hypothetical protein SEA_MOAB_94 [Streptomyces phage Moab]